MNSFSDSGTGIALISNSSINEDSSESVLPSAIIEQNEDCDDLSVSHCTLKRKNTARPHHLHSEYEFSDVVRCCNLFTSLICSEKGFHVSK